MKAILWTGYGPPEVLRAADIEKPVPGDGEVLIRIEATTVTAGDCETRSLRFGPILALFIRLYAGLVKPKRITVLGQELSGRIEAVGRNVKRFKPGDDVFAATGFGMGGYAEYIRLPAEPSEMEGVLESKPSNLTFEEAAAVPVGGLEALHFLGKADIRRGRKVLINGAGGSIGTIAVQIAKHLGAEVTAVDSEDKLDMLRSIGADHVIDYAAEDFTAGGPVYDVILDVAGVSSLSRTLRALTPDGSLLLANAGFARMVRGRLISSAGGRKVISGPSGRRSEDLARLKELVEAGAVRPVIDRRFSLDRIVEAHRYVESGRKRGNVVITVDHSG